MAAAKPECKARWTARAGLRGLDCAGDRSRRQRFVDAVCIGLSRAQKTRGLTVQQRRLPAGCGTAEAKPQRKKRVRHVRRGCAGSVATGASIFRWPDVDQRRQSLAPAAWI